jgi:DNA (cytosine-5)-methyltransferase 1
MIFGSVFAGIGGFDKGLEDAGLICAWQIEVDKDCNRVLARHWPNVRRYGDITTLDPSDLPPVDLLCGGFPCQDLSLAGRREGLAGARSGLFFEFMRLVAALRPRWVLIENVFGLLSSNGTKDMGTVVGTLAELGFWWAYRCLDAQYFGLAQRRKRVFIVGHSGKRSAPVSVLFEPESVSRDFAPSRKAGSVPPSILESSAGTDRPGGPRLAQEDQSLIVGALTPVRGSPGDNDAQAGHLVVARPLNAPRSPRYDGDSETFVVAIRGGMVVRRLTPRECERLQGFPDDWTAIDAQGRAISDSARYRMLGNAVAVPAARWIGKRILEAEARVVLRE